MIPMRGNDPSSSLGPYLGACTPIARSVRKNSVKGTGRPSPGRRDSLPSGCRPRPRAAHLRRCGTRPTRRCTRRRPRAGRRRAAAGQGRSRRRASRRAPADRDWRGCRGAVGAHVVEDQAQVGERWVKALLEPSADVIRPELVGVDAAGAASRWSRGRASRRSRKRPRTASAG